MAHQVTPTHFYYYHHHLPLSQQQHVLPCPSSTETTARTVAPQDTLRQLPQQRIAQTTTNQVLPQQPPQPPQPQPRTTPARPVQPPQRVLPPPPPPQPPQQPQPTQTEPQSTTGPRVATGDWTKDLVQLAKTAELKKHALTLQLHTAHILSNHAVLEQKNKMIQDAKEQKNKLDSERAILLDQLARVNQDRDLIDITITSLIKECDGMKAKIQILQDGEYAIAKSDVDRLRIELGQPPLPSLQNTLDERSNQYLTNRRLASHPQNTTQNPAAPSPTAPAPTAAALPNVPPAPPPTTTTNRPRPTLSSALAGVIRPAPPPEIGPNGRPLSQPGEPPLKKSRGRPKGSKNRSK